MAANGRRGRPQGKCHREETAGAGRPAKARVKRCGKSAPRCRQRQRHGKPHREQDRIGAARVSGQLGIQRDPRRRPGWLLEARSNPRPRGMAVAEGNLQTEPGLQAGWQFVSDAVQRTRVLARLGHDHHNARESPARSSPSRRARTGWRGDRYRDGRGCGCQARSRRADCTPAGAVGYKLPRARRAQGAACRRARVLRTLGRARYQLNCPHPDCEQ